MKIHKFTCEPVDESFFSSAPVVLTGNFEIDLPASSVWDDLVSEHPLAFCRILGGNAVHWTSPRPFGVGTTRRVNALKGLNDVDELYFIWEEGRRKAFYVTESGNPMFKRFAEDYLVEPRGDDACTFTWTIAYEPTLLGKGPVNKLVMKTMFADTAKHYKAN
jgi:hypothetical protein